MRHEFRIAGCELLIYNRSALLFCKNVDYDDRRKCATVAKDRLSDSLAILVFQSESRRVGGRFRPLGPNIMSALKLINGAITLKGDYC